MTRVHWTKSTATTGTSSGRSTTTRPRRWAGSVSMPAARMSPSSYSSRRGSHACASRRERSSRAPMLLLRRATSPTMARSSSRTLFSSQSTSALQEVAHRRRERGERGLQLVRHGREQAGLEPVGLALGRRERGLRLQPFALEERADQIGERLDQARLGRRSTARPSGAPATASTPTTPEGLLHRHVQPSVVVRAQASSVAAEGSGRVAGTEDGLSGALPRCGSASPSPSRYERNVSPSRTKRVADAGAEHLASPRARQVRAISSVDV